MSVKIMGQVFYLPHLSPAEKLTLLALADNADDHGVCWPSMATIAQKTCQSERNARRMVRNLEARGQLHVEGSGGKNPNRYTVTPNPDRLSAVETSPNPDTTGHQPGHHGSPTRTQLCPPNRQEPSENLGGGSARVREGLLDEIASMANADLRRMDWLDFNLRPAVERWLALGLDEAEVRETVRTVMASRRDPGPVATPRYFDNAMQRAAGEKQRPALQPINGGRAPPAAESAHPHVDIDAILARREQKRREQGNG